MSIDVSEFNTFCREQNMDFEISEGIVVKPVVEKRDRHYFNKNRLLNRQARTVANNTSEYMCDKCNEEPAFTWIEDHGAMCKTCCGPIPNFVEVISEDDISY